MPRIFGTALVMVLAVGFAIISRTRARQSWLAILASMNCTIFFVFGVALSLFDLPAWRVQIFIERLIELPVVTSVSILCLLQARWVMNPRIKRVLQAAPAVMLSAWFIALVGELIWPQPILNPFAQMPLRNFLLLVPLCVPILFYLSLLTYLFARKAGSRVPAVRLKIQNSLLAIGICAYFFVVANVVVGYGFQTFISGELLRRTTEMQIAIEDRLFLVIALALPTALLLGTVPTASRVLLRTGVLEFLTLRDRFETRKWQIASTGVLKGLTRARYHASQAASTLNLPDDEREKTIATVELTAILANHEMPEELSSEKARQLLDLQGEISQLEPELLGYCLSHLASLKNPEMRPDVTDHFPEALEGAVRLTQPSIRFNSASPHFTDSVWYGLASVVCAENCLINDAPEAAGSLSYNRASRAYRESIRASA